MRAHWIIDLGYLAKCLPMHTISIEGMRSVISRLPIPVDVSMHNGLHLHNNVAFFYAVAQREGFRVVLGSIVNNRQVGVDRAIIADIDAAAGPVILTSGDGDFTEAMVRASARGCETILLALRGEALSSSLMASCARVLYLEDYRVLRRRSWVRRAICRSLECQATAG